MNAPTTEAVITVNLVDLEQMIRRVVREVVREEFTYLLRAPAPSVLDDRGEENFLRRQVEETRVYRRQHPEDVQTVTAAEWEAVTADLEREV